MKLAARPFTSAVLLLLAVSACAAPGVVETDDPYRKLAQARQLEDSGRLAVAKRLIFEAMEIFEERRDDLGLAEAYRQYGFFVRVNGEEAVIRLDSATPDPTNEDGRMDKSIEYFRKAFGIVEAQGDLGLVTNLHYHIGVSHHYAGRSGAACKSLDESLSTYRKSKEIRPDLTVDLPEFVKDYPELIDRAKAEFKCT